MLTQLELKNFRCFDRHTVELQRSTLLVGKNNAGKSTCVEALRLVSLVTERMANLNFKTPPPEFELPRGCKGFSPSLDSIALHTECLFHRYGNSPAFVRAIFQNKSRLEIHIGEKMVIHAVVYDQNGRVATARQAVEAAAIPRVSILPQISPLAEQETQLTEVYVRANLQTSRSSLHFRNQLKIYPEHFKAFKELVSSTWPNFRIESLDLPSLLEPEGRITLMVRDDDFTAEIAWMGHGLQMWLQTMWFLSRNQQSAVLILDEPDVYMHADLQRKLVRMLMRDKRQFIIATHSPEMLAEVDPESVVVLNRSKPSSKSAASAAAVQELLNHVGSIHNISLAKLANYNRILLVEGEDVPILKLFQDALDPAAACPIDAIPNSDIEGWSRWPSVVTMAKFFRKNASENIKIFCLLDRDYHSDQEIQARMEEAARTGIHLHVWSWKEVENYVVSPEAISRYLTAEAGHTITTEGVRSIITSLATGLKDETIDAYSEAIRIQNKQGANKSNPLARAIVDERWNRLGGHAVVNGKTLFSAVAKWTQDTFGVCINSRKVLRAMLPEEVPPEVAGFIRQVTDFERNFT